VRDYFESRGAVPEARTLFKSLAHRHAKDRATCRYLYELFPYGYGQHACKIAGMRKPRQHMLDV
jgi:TusE/DsrC/DsvC family sulfur relay protein